MKRSIVPSTADHSITLSLCLYSNKVFCWLCYSASTLLVSNPTLKKKRKSLIFSTFWEHFSTWFSWGITLDFNTDALATAQMKINDFEKQHTEGNWVNIKLETLYFVCVWLPYGSSRLFFKTYFQSIYHFCQSSSIKRKGTTWCWHLNPLWNVISNKEDWEQQSKVSTLIITTFLTQIDPYFLKSLLGNILILPQMNYENVPLKYESDQCVGVSDIYDIDFLHFFRLLCWLRVQGAGIWIS